MKRREFITLLGGGGQQTSPSRWRLFRWKIARPAANFCDVAFEPGKPSARIGVVDANRQRQFLEFR